MNEKELYEKAIYFQKSEKNYDKAMELYEQIIKDYSNRGLCSNGTENYNKNPFIYNC